MRFLREWGQRLLGSLRPRRPDEDLEEELRLHLDLAAEDARRRGEPVTEADRAARLKVGGIPQAMEALRDQRGLPILSGMRQDLRLSLRALRATPIVTAVVILSLALAIGANTAIFSLVNSLLLRALPVHEPERLVHVTDTVVLESRDDAGACLELSAMGPDSASGGSSFRRQPPGRSSGSTAPLAAKRSSSTASGPAGRISTRLACEPFSVGPCRRWMTDGAAAPTVLLRSSATAIGSSSSAAPST